MAYKYKSDADAWKRRNPDKISGYNKKYRTEDKLKIIQALGGRCINCGVSDVDVLQFDHIRNDGNKDIGRIKGHRYLLLYYSKNLDKAKQNLQLLCANCNIKKNMIYLELCRLSRLSISISKQKSL